MVSVMYRSRSAPGLGLGTGIDPSRGYRFDSVSTLSLTLEEEEAERLYYAARSTSLTKAAFKIHAKDLSRRSIEGSAYLTWLIMHCGQKWPSVAAAK